MHDILFRHYVTFFTVPYRKLHLPSPIPEKIKTYLRGTLRLYWMWTSFLMGSIFTVLSFGFSLIAVLRGDIPMHMYLHSMGTIALITMFCFMAWTVGYYIYFRVVIVQDLKHIIKDKIY